MKHFLFPAAALCSMGVALALCGCQPQGESGQAASQTPSAAAGTTLPPASTAMPAASQAAASAASAAAASAAQGPLLKGIYTWGPEVESFAPCNTDKTYWLEGSDALLAPLQDIAMKKADAANEAYQPVYVEIHAHDIGKASDGFAVEYDSVMRLDQVAAANAEVPADCKLLGNN